MHKPQRGRSGGGKGNGVLQNLPTPLQVPLSSAIWSCIALCWLYSFCAVALSLPVKRIERTRREESEEREWKEGDETGDNVGRIVSKNKRKSPHTHLEPVTGVETGRGSSIYPPFSAKEPKRERGEMEDGRQETSHLVEGERDAKSPPPPYHARDHNDGAPILFAPVATVAIDFDSGERETTEERSFEDAFENNGEDPLNSEATEVGPNAEHNYTGVSLPQGDENPKAAVPQMQDEREASKNSEPEGVTDGDVFHWSSNEYEEQHDNDETETRLSVPGSWVTDDIPTDDFISGGGQMVHTAFKQSEKEPQSPETEKEGPESKRGAVGFEQGIPAHAQVSSEDSQGFSKGLEQLRGHDVETSSQVSHEDDEPEVQGEFDTNVNPQTSIEASHEASVRINDEPAFYDEQRTDSDVDEMDDYTRAFGTVLPDEPEPESSASDSAETETFREAFHEALALSTMPLLLGALMQAAMEESPETDASDRFLSPQATVTTSDEFFDSRVAENESDSDTQDDPMIVQFAQGNSRETRDSDSDEGATNSAETSSTASVNTDAAEPYYVHLTNDPTCRFFHEKIDTHSETHIVNACKMLNEHIGILVINLLDMWDAEQQAEDETYGLSSNSRGPGFVETVKSVLGSKLYKKISPPPTSSNEDSVSDQHLQDALQAWAANVMCTSLDPQQVVFGSHELTPSHISSITQLMQKDGSYKESTIFHAYLLHCVEPANASYWCDLLNRDEHLVGQITYPRPGTSDENHALKEIFRLIQHHGISGLCLPR